VAFAPGRTGADATFGRRCAKHPARAKRRAAAPGGDRHANWRCFGAQTGSRCCGNLDTVNLTRRPLFWLGIGALLFGAIGAFLFGSFVAADHRLSSGGTKVGEANLNAVTASDTAWLWGCVAIGVLGLAVIVVLIIRDRRDY
jgi:hypothetical protein